MASKKQAGKNLYFHLMREQNYSHKEALNTVKRLGYPLTAKDL